MLGTFQILPIPVNNNNLPRLGETRFQYSTTTPGISTVKLTLKSGLTQPVKMRVGSLAHGEFFTDSGGTTSAGQEINLGTTAGNKVFYFKGYANGVLSLLNSDGVSALGVPNAADWSAGSDFMTNPTNCRIVNFNLAELGNFTALTSVVIGESRVYGDISVLAPFSGLTTFAVGNDPIYGAMTGSSSVFVGKPMRAIAIQNLGGFDMKNIPNSILNVQLAGGAQKRYTGDGLSAISTNVLGSYSCFGTPGMPTSEVDNLIKALSLVPAAPSMRTLNISGARTSASDAAIATLTGKNYTIALF